MLSGQDFRGEKPSRSQESWRFFEFPEAGHSADEIATNPAAGRCVLGPIITRNGLCILIISPNSAAEDCVFDRN